jgi:hypothetical protein
MSRATARHDDTALHRQIIAVEEEIARTSPGDDAFGGLIRDRASLLRHAQENAHRSRERR